MPVDVTAYTNAPSAAVSRRSMARQRPDVRGRSMAAPSECTAGILCPFAPRALSGLRHQSAGNRHVQIDGAIEIGDRDVLVRRVRHAYRAGPDEERSAPAIEKRNVRRE